MPNTRKQPKKKENKQYREEYRKERKRITNYIGYMRRKGYLVDTIELPEIPQRVLKKDIRELKKITSEKLKEQMIFFNPFTGEYVEAKDAKESKRLKEEFEEESIRTGIYDVYFPEDPLYEYVDEDLVNMKIIENFLSTLYTVGIPNTEKRIKNALREMFARYEFEDIASMLEKAAESGIRLRVNINYPDGLNAAREVQFLRETMELLPIAFDEEQIYDMEQRYRDYYEENEWY